jgi:heme a synthase
MSAEFAESSYYLIVAESKLKWSAVTDRRYSAWLNRFVWFTAFATLLLICSGGMVTSKGVGLAVPDWPTTFGYNMFLFPVSKWIGGVLFEHTHRLIASAVGFLTLILAVWLWRTEDRQSVKTLGLIAVAGVILQGILGGLRVTMLKDQIGIFHACLAQAFLGLIVLIALMTTNVWPTLGENLTVLNGQVYQQLRRIKTLAIVTTIAIYAQLALGATMRHQHKDLAILDFPTANGAWIPDTSATALTKINTWREARALSDVDAFQIWLQVSHRILAVLIGIAVIMFAVRIRRLRKSSRAPILSGLSIWWVVLFFLQFTLGAWTIWSNKAADVATTHVAVGAIMLSFGVSAWAICSRVLQPSMDESGNH